MPTKDSVPLFPFSRPSDHQPPTEFAKLRATEPVSRVKLWDNTEPWMITKHKDVCQVLADDRFTKVRTHPNFPELNPRGKMAAAAAKPTFVDMDPPEHTKQRAMVMDFFTKDYVERNRPMIESVVDSCIQRLKRCQQPADLHSEFAIHIPYLVIAKVLGIPEEDTARFIQWTAVRSSGSSTAREASQASQDLMDYMRRLVEKKISNPGDNDVISKLVVDQLRPGHTDIEDVVQISFLLLVAGNATVANEISLGLVALKEHPEMLNDIKSNPALIPDFVEEVLRYFTSSAMACRRVAKVDVQVGDKTIRADEGLIASNQSGNRDESVFENPDEFRIRKPNPHLGFGYGIHYCPGEWWARAEMQIAFERLFKELPNLRISGDIKYSDPDKDVGIVALPVSW
ncbi:hypothetical protein HDU85_003603 [Gaertneriomyces sp. JEL0708]|nr:hypothetical protein HDU85_003603 [Gaertneriomyces sp. JEL0708]